MGVLNLSTLFLLISIICTIDSAPMVERGNRAVSEIRKIRIPGAARAVIHFSPVMRQFPNEAIHFPPFLRQISPILLPHLRQTPLGMRHISPKLRQGDWYPKFPSPFPVPYPNPSGGW